jgi:hypothetical protein
MKARITILASDIHEASYIDGYDCPITRGLRRAGFRGIHDAGLDITTDFDADKESVIVLDHTDPNYEELTTRVVKMYNAKQVGLYDEIVDFSICLEIPEKYYVGVKQEEVPCV